MKKKINSQKGSIAPLIVIVVILIVLAIWFAGAKKGTPVPTPTPTPTPAPITLISPNGGETLVIGATTTVSFKTDAEITDAYRVVIWLDEGAAPLATIPATTTSYSFKLPSSVLIGGDAMAPLQVGNYRIRVTLYDGIPCTGLCPSPATVKEIGSDSSDGEITIATSSSKILSPKEGDRIKAGSTLEIKWDKENIGDRVLLVLHMGSVQKVISPDERAALLTVPNTGSITWKVPASFDELNATPVDRDYPAYITLNDAQKSTIVIGRSGTFIITK